MHTITHSRRLVRTRWIFYTIPVWLVIEAVFIGGAIALPLWISWLFGLSAIACTSLLAWVGIGWSKARMTVDGDTFHAYGWGKPVTIRRSEITRFISEAREYPNLSMFLWPTSTSQPRLWFVIAELKSGEGIPITCSFAPRKLSKEQVIELNSWLQLDAPS